MEKFKFKVKEALNVDVPGVDFYSASIEVPINDKGELDDKRRLNDKGRYAHHRKTALLAVIGKSEVSGPISAVSISAVLLENLINAFWTQKTLPQFQEILEKQVEWK